MKLNYLFLGLCLGISSCANIATPESLAKTMVGHSIITQNENRNKNIIFVREVNNNFKEYEYKPDLRWNPSCIITWTTDANGIIKSHRLNDKC